MRFGIEIAKSVQQNLSHPEAHTGIAHPNSKNRWVTTTQPPSRASRNPPKYLFNGSARGGHSAHRKNSSASSAPIAAPRARDKKSGYQVW